MPFLKRRLGFDFTEIALISQPMGLLGTLLGGLSAGVLVARFGLRRMLLAFGALQALTNLLYTALALTGPSYGMFATAVLVDHLANAMGSATFVAFLMPLCDARVSATQFALLTSLSSIGGRVFGAAAGHLQIWLGWPGFYASTALAAIPGLVILGWLMMTAQNGDPSARVPGEATADETV
jgi:PAT family beta-lactamase induction signal transducer AmpG